MKQQDRRNANLILDLAKARLEKAGFEDRAIWEGFSLSAHSQGGSGWRPDPLARKIDKIQRDRPDNKELTAWHIVRSLSDMEFDCVFIWHCIRSQFKPGTQERYRICDLLAVLTYKYYSNVSITHGHSFPNDAWGKTYSEALQQIADKYEKVYPPKKKKKDDAEGEEKAEIQSA